MNCDLCGRAIKWSYDTSNATQCCSCCWDPDAEIGDHQRFMGCHPNGHGPFDYGTGGGIRLIRDTKTY